jgi:DNA polymerase-3 subunit delta
MRDDDLIYLFTGTSEIFIKNRMNRIIQGFKNEETTIIKYDMDTSTLTQVLEDALTIPFLEDLKIIIIKNPRFLTKNANTSKDDAKAFTKYLKKPSDTTILIVDATNIVIHQANDIYKTLRNVARIIDYPEPEEIEIKGWIVRTFDGNNIDIKDDALNLLMEYIGDDQPRLSQEIDKLTSYVGKGGTVYVKDIKKLVPKDVSNEIYNLIKAIVNHDFNKTNSIYNTLINNTKDPLMIFSMISNKFKELISTYKLLKFGYSQSDIAKFYNVSTGKAYYIVQEAKSFRLEDLEYYIEKLATLDYQIKSGKLDKSIALELLLLRINNE